MTVLAQITMNAGEGIPGSVIKWNLRENAKYFDRVIVVDGNLTEEAGAFYSQFDNVEVVDSPWNDSYVNQYEAFSRHLTNGEWCLYLDCDEIPSNDLLKELDRVEKEPIVELFELPCILHITEDQKRYYPAETKPQSYRHPDTWTKKILFKKTDDLHFRHCGSHVIPSTNTGKYAYLQSPYFHMKSLESFVLNDVWQAFLSPEGQGYTPVESANFKRFTRQYKSTAEFKKATREGTWSPPLQKFALEHGLDYSRPISRLAWVYFILEANQGAQDGPTWDEVKNYVLKKEDMELLNENKKQGNFIKID